MSDPIEVVIRQEETGPTAPVAGSTRPDHIPEKFWNAEKGEVNTDALLKSYTALEGRLGGAEQGATEDAPDETPGGEEGAAEQVADAAGIDMAAVEAHYLESGEIPADTYERLSKVGVTKEMVDEFVQYRVGQADAIRNEVLNTAGGEEAVTKMAEWAGKNYTPAQADAFNKAMESKDRGQMEIALRALKADFEKVNGSRPARVITPTTASVASGGSYASFAQLLQDQRDPRYATDPAFRAQVVEKLKRSNV